MKYAIIWSAFAESQLDEIFEYYVENARSYNVAKKLVTKIITETDILAGNPHIGQIEELLPDREEDYRYLVCGNYKIIYTIDNATHRIKIADVFDTRQNPSKIKRNK